MKILFSPSEAKNPDNDFDPIHKQSFIFEELFEYRLEALRHFQNYILKANDKDLSQLFGLKNEKEFTPFKQDILSLETNLAIKRYSGVSYEYLDYESLDTKAQNFLLENTVIFSNLFGPILAKDKIPFYKFKQGAKIKDFNIEQFYKEKFSPSLDEFLKGENIIDLRASFYEKFYSIKQNFSTFKFLKNGKIISHFAKAYRGTLLRTIAKNQLKSTQDLLDHLPCELKLKDIKIQGFKQEITLELL